MNKNHKIKKHSRDSDLVFYASIDKSMDRSEANKHYEIPKNEIKDIKPYALGEIEPDEKYKVKGIENIIIAKQKEWGGLPNLFLTFNPPLGQ